MGLFTEAEEMAIEAWEQTGDRDDAMDFLHQSCDSHEAAIYHYKGIIFCADNDTSDGEQYLEDCGGISQPGDSFGQIACRIAYATLLVAAQNELEIFINQLEEAA
jgi:hypothetical protein